MIYSFYNDYSDGCHADILEVMRMTNRSQEFGYGEDSICRDAVEKIRQVTGRPHAAVHLLSGATQANKIIISSALKAHEAVVATNTGHIAIHEAGAIESSGHKVCTVESADGKLTPSLVDLVVKFHTDEHMVKPKMVYISNTTETGLVYLKSELMKLSDYCRQNDLLLFIDGARLGQALTSPANDITLKELAEIPDIFYIGGTKNGALLGEAVVINNEKLKSDFRYYMKQNGALLAKGRVLGAQFLGLFNNDLFYKNGRHANQMALKLSEGIKMAGYKFNFEPASNQIFPILPNTLIDYLKDDYGFYIWAPDYGDNSIIRLVTSWATPEIEIDGFIEKLSGWVNNQIYSIKSL